jgi:hypothetical protein
MGFVSRMKLGALAALVVLSMHSMQPAAAEGDPRPPLLELFNFERLSGFAMQWALLMLRSQVEITYDTVSSDPYAGRAVIGNIKLWPMPPWDTEHTCGVEADRLQIGSGEVMDWDRMRVRLELTGVRAPLSCLPPDLQPLFTGLGMDTFTADRLYADVDYSMGSSALDISAHASLPGLAAISAALTFPYFAIQDESVPPTMVLSHASVQIDDLGLWARAQPMMPPEMNLPEVAAQFVGDTLVALLQEENQTGGGPSTLSAAQTAFVQSAMVVTNDFVAKPGTVVLETKLLEPLYLSEAMLGDPRQLFDATQPVFAPQPAARAAILPASLLKTALDAPDSLSPADRLMAGKALADGAGVPKAPALGQALLQPLADSGDSEAAMALARSLGDTEPERAYRYALRAGAAGASGAAGLLDRLETRLTTPDVLKLQAELSEQVPSPDTPPLPLATIRENAFQHLRGEGAARSYRMAYFWAALGAAAGDAASQSLREDIEARMRYRGDAAASAWKTEAEEAAADALHVWLSADYPAALQ